MFEQAFAIGKQFGNRIRDFWVANSETDFLKKHLAALPERRRSRPDGKADAARVLRKNELGTNRKGAPLDDQKGQVGGRAFPNTFINYFVIWAIDFITNLAIHRRAAFLRKGDLELSNQDFFPNQGRQSGKEGIVLGVDDVRVISLRRLKGEEPDFGRLRSVRRYEQKDKDEQDAEGGGSNNDGFAASHRSMRKIRGQNVQN
jgi:hypothetical protein